MKKFKVFIWGTYEWERLFEAEAEDRDGAIDKAKTLSRSIYECMTRKAINDIVKEFQKNGRLSGVKLLGVDDWRDKDYDVEELEDEKVGKEK